MIVNLIKFPTKVYFKQDFIESILFFKDTSSVPGVKITIDTNKEELITVSLE